MELDAVKKLRWNTAKGVDRKDSNRMGPLLHLNRYASPGILKIKRAREGFLGKKDRRWAHAEEKDRQNAISQVI